MDAVHLEWGTVLLRLVAAAGFGLVIGIQREVDGHAAGARTHALLALGAALFGAISVGAFGDYVAPRNATNTTLDVTRVASYVAAGIGFLGAGAIRKGDDAIHGLTTAASLWTAAAVGLAAGLGFWPGAVIATVLVLVMLLAERPVAWLKHHLARPSKAGSRG